MYDYLYIYILMKYFNEKNVQSHPLYKVKYA